MIGKLKLLKSKSLNNIIWFSRFLKPYKNKGILAGICMFINILLRLPLPLLTMYVIDHVLLKSSPESLKMLGFICSGLLIVLLLQGLFNFFQSYLVTVFKENIILDIKLKIFQHFQFLSLSFFHSKQTGYLMSRIDDASSAQGLLADTILNFLRDSLTFLVGLILIFVLNWKLALASITILPFFIISLTAFSQRLRELSKESREKQALVSQNIQESLSGIHLVKAFVREKYEIRKLLTNLTQAMRINIRSTVWGKAVGVLTAVMGGTGPIVILWYGGSQVINGSLTLGKLIAFNGFVGYLFGPTQRLAKLNVTVQQSLGAIERIREVLAIAPSITEKKEAKLLPKIKGHVQFKNVSFSYDSQRNKILNNINIEVEPGMVVAIVGHSGVGKTTLVNLIPRFYDPSNGSILIDGHDIRDFTKDSLRKQIGIVSQDVFLFAGTVEDNVRYGRLDAPKEKIIEACQAANAEGFILELPEGYKTLIGERGVKLSGGQKQRLAIARAVLKNPRILILDEATSSVDSQSESLIREAMERLMKNRTSFVIAHRLSTILSSDKILVLDKGRIVEEGRFEELYDKGGIFKQLYDKELKIKKGDQKNARVKSIAV